MGCSSCSGSSNKNSMPKRGLLLWREMLFMRPHFWAFAGTWSAAVEASFQDRVTPLCVSECVLCEEAASWCGSWCACRRRVNCRWPPVSATDAAPDVPQRCLSGCVFVCVPATCVVRCLQCVWVRRVLSSAYAQADTLVVDRCKRVSTGASV